MITLRFATSLALSGLLACTSKATLPDAAAAALPAVEEASLDRSADPCDDFYQFACGGWMKANPIPPEHSTWGRSFSEIDKRNQERIRTLLEATSAGTSKDPDAHKLSDLYATCMDEAKAETASPKTLQLILLRINGVRDLPGLAREVGRLHGEGTGVFFRFNSQQDAKDATQVIGYAHQGGLGLPDRDFYLKDDEKTQRIRTLYVEHVGKMLELAGLAKDTAEAQAKSVIEIETALAKTSLTRVQLRDPQVTYHRIDRAGLAKAAPKFPWDAYFTALEREGLQAINVEAPAFFEGFDAVLATAQAEALRAYLRWHAVNSASSKLGKAFVDESFRFGSTAFTGTTQDLPRWKKCVAFTTQAMGQSVGRLFVEGAFSPEAKGISIEMIRRIEDAFEAQVGSIAWMDDATKVKAREKLHKIANQIGYPNQWLDYSALEPASDSYLANALKAARFAARRDLDKIGKPLDREDWQWPPSIVNAQYDPQLNRMQFPAGILQPPFFSRDHSPAQNYGGIGFVMGHELIHGFDDEGRQYDADGNLRDWWTPASGKAYDERSQCVEKQYSAYTVLDGQALNGKLTLGENIADIGGLKMALGALRKAHAGMPDDKLAGFTRDQRFFIAAGQVWCSQDREPMARLRLTIDPHSPSRYRVNGPMQDSPDFEKAFQCKPGSKLAPANRCEVW